MAWLTPRIHLPALLALLLLLFVNRPALHAADAEGSSSGDNQSILTMIEDSGPSGIAFLVVLGLFSLVGVAITIERLVNLNRSKIIPYAFLQEMQQLVQRGDTRAEGFHSLCARFPLPISKILKAGLLRAGRSLTEVEKAMEDAAARENAAVRSRIRPLTVIGSVAPLVGLLGTVVGMIIAFRTASEKGLGGKAEILAEGIYLALLTTAAGLTIAIPSLLFAAYFNTRVDKFMREIDEHLMETIPCFVNLEPSRREPPASDNNKAEHPPSEQELVSAQR